MDFISDGWREELQEEIDNTISDLWGTSAYAQGYKDGLRKAIEIIGNHL